MRPSLPFRHALWTILFLPMVVIVDLKCWIGDPTIHTHRHTASAWTCTWLQAILAERVGRASGLLSVSCSQACLPDSFMSDVFVCQLPCELGIETLRFTFIFTEASNAFVPGAGHLAIGLLRLEQTRHKDQCSLNTEGGLEANENSK